MKNSFLQIVFENTFTKQFFTKEILRIPKEKME